LGGRELVIGELNDPGGPVFDRYRLSFDQSKDGPESLPFRMD